MDRSMDSERLIDRELIYSYRNEKEEGEEEREEDAREIDRWIDRWIIERVIIDRVL
jgi:hypothetical protein